MTQLLKEWTNITQNWENIYTTLGIASCSFVAAYTAGVAIYRVYFHPLRNVPGPKLAAITQWVETYYECFKGPGGQFMWEYKKWHEKYGPIVRISPNEVHIQDPVFYDVLYAQSRHSDKLKKLERRFNNETSSFGTADHNVHRMRRSALNPFFSKRKIAQHSHNIQTHMNRLCKRVATEFAGQSDAILNLTNMWGAFASDNVVGYCLEEPYDFIMNPEFRAPFSEAMVDLLRPVHFLTQFPWMVTLSKLVPERLLGAMYAPMRSVFSFNSEMERQILRAKMVHASGEKNGESPLTLFTALLNSDLPPQELSTKRLQHEAISVIGAGVETTKFTLMTGSFHLLANPAQLARLREELDRAIPDISNIPSLDTLIQLPYLTCVINESLRFAYGTPQRMQRLSPTAMVYSNPITYMTYMLPVGSIVSMDNYTMSHDPHMFPEPFAFRPERWEDNALAPDNKPLSRYLVAFGRGTRSCVGMQFAYAELYVGMANFFRRFQCELFETERDAVDIHLESFIPRPKPGTKGVRVKVLSAV